MEELLKKVKRIINGQEASCQYIGMILYLLTSEEEPYKIYKLNLDNNGKFLEILIDNINEIPDELRVSYYPMCTRPDCTEDISYLPVHEIPDYNEIRSKLIADDISVLTRDSLEEVAGKSKGYVIRFLYEEDGDSKSLFSYLRMTQSAFLKREKLLFCFDKENGELLTEVKGIQLKFDDKLVSINIDDTMLILNGHSFEILFKYETHINTTALLALDSIERSELIENFDVMLQYCIGNKPMKNKLYKIYSQGNLGSIGIDDFKRVKEACGEQLAIDIDEDNGKISVQEGNSRKSIDHILRVYNDESAETIVSGTKIFADKKIPMN